MKSFRPDLEKKRSPVVQTESGAVVGKILSLPYSKSVYEYLGIPYAKPPVGELRFAAPKPAKPWSGIKECIEFGASCPQPPSPLPVHETVQGMLSHQTLSIKSKVMEYAIEILRTFNRYTMESKTLLVRSR